jgi:hypothetical protein
MAPGRAKHAPGEGRVGIGIAIGIENEVEPEVRTLGRSGLLRGMGQWCQSRLGSGPGVGAKTR